MKTVKKLLAILIRLALILSPGIVFVILFWSVLPPVINILAAVGLETIFLTASVWISTMAVSVHEARKNYMADQETDPLTDE